MEFSLPVKYDKSDEGLQSLVAVDGDAAADAADFRDDTLMIGPFKGFRPKDDEVLSLLVSKGCTKIKDISGSMKKHFVFVKFECENDASDAMSMCTGNLIYDSTPLSVRYRNQFPKKKNTSVTSDHVKSIRPWSRNSAALIRSHLSKTTGDPSETSHKSYNLPNLMQLNPLSKSAAQPPKVPSLMDLDVAPFDRGPLDDYYRGCRSVASSNFASSGDFGPGGAGRVYENAQCFVEKPPPVHLRPPSPSIFRDESFDLAEPPPSRYDCGALDQPADWERRAPLLQRRGGGGGGGRSRSRSRSPAAGRRPSRDSSEERFGRPGRRYDDEPRGRSPRVDAHVEFYCKQVAERLNRMNDQQRCFARMKIEEALYDAQYGIGKDAGGALTATAGGVDAGAVFLSTMTDEQQNHRVAPKSRGGGGGAAAGGDDFSVQDYGHRSTGAGNGSRPQPLMALRNTGRSALGAQHSASLLNGLISILDQDRRDV